MTGSSKHQIVSEKIREVFLSNPYIHSVLKSYLIGIVHLRKITSEKLLSAQLLNPSSSWKDNLILDELRNAHPPLVDVGCGWGWLIFEASKFGIFTIGIDIDARLIKHTKTALNLTGIRPPLIVASATHLPLKDASVRMLAYIEVIEHIQETNLIFSEAKRVSKVGGKVLITTPNTYSIESFIAKIVSRLLRLKPCGSHLHKKLFTPQMVHQFAQANYFCITKSLGIGLFMVTIVFLSKLLNFPELNRFLQMLDLRLARLLPTFTSCCVITLKRSQ